MAWGFKYRKAIKFPKFCKYCFNHNIAVLYSGHQNYCNFKNCPCQKCRKTAQKLEEMKLRRRIKRQMKRQAQNERRNVIENFLITTSNMSHDVPSTSGVHAHRSDTSTPVNEGFLANYPHLAGQSCSDLENYYNYLYISRRKSIISSSEESLDPDDEMLSLLLHLTLTNDDVFSDDDDDD